MPWSRTTLPVSEAVMLRGLTFCLYGENVAIITELLSNTFPNRHCLSM